MFLEKIYFNKNCIHSEAIGIVSVLSQTNNGKMNISNLITFLVLFLVFKENLAIPSTQDSPSVPPRRDYREATYCSNKESWMKRKMILRKW